MINWIRVLIFCKQAQVKHDKQASLITLLIILVVPSHILFPFLNVFRLHPTCYLFHGQNDLFLKVRETKPLKSNG